jgi:CHASE3 domain sensor protein
MKISNTKISKQLMVGFIIILSFVLILGVVSSYQSDRLHHQTEIMHQHPLQIRRAIGSLGNDISAIRISLRDLILEEDTEVRHTNVQTIALSNADAEKQLSIIKENYLGSTLPLCR